MCLFWLIMFSLINYWGCHYHSAAFALMGLDLCKGTDWGFSCGCARRLCTYSMCWQRGRKNKRNTSDHWEQFVLKEKRHKNSLTTSVINLSTRRFNVGFKCLSLRNITQFNVQKLYVLYGANWWLSGVRLMLYFGRLSDAFVYNRRLN